MECDCNIHHILRDEITVVDSSFECLKLVPRPKVERCRSELFSIIDKMGYLSAKAQSLPGAITTGMKLMYSEHRLYILKDTMPDSRQVIGILKVGCKKLFVYDMHGVQHELEPLCVLDFYVHESRQRQGCGKKLFEYMIRREGVIPRHLAIDRPSHKFSAFLEKHYQLSNVIPQMNNFVVFQGFFRDRSDYPRGRRYRSAANELPRNNRSSSASYQPQTSAPTNRLTSSPSLPRLQSPKKGLVSVRKPPGPTQPPAAMVETQPSVHLANNLNSMTLDDEANPAPRVTERDRPGVGEARATVHVGTWRDEVEQPVPKPMKERERLREEPAGVSLLRRNEATRDILNGHQEYLTRDGRLRVGPLGNSRREAQSANYSSHGSANLSGATRAADQANQTTSWSVYSAANGYTYQQGLNRNYRHTRLW